MRDWDKYIYDVLDEKILTCKWTKLACERHLNDLKRKDIYFDVEDAQRWIDFVCLFVFYDGTKKGERVQLEGWLKFYFAMVFGWKRKDGTRRFRKTYLEVARKNSKTTTEALQAVAHLFLDSAEAPEVFIGATKKDQAIILVNKAGQMIQATKEIKDRFKFYTYNGRINKIILPERNGGIYPLGRDSKTEDGSHPSMAIIDEYHEHPTDDLVNVMRSGMVSRIEPLLSIITTAGFNKDNPCFQEREYAQAVLEGYKEDDSFWSNIYTLDKDDDWEDVTKYEKANPNMGASVRLENLKIDLNEAKNQRGTKEVNFKTKNLNIWCDAAEVWIPDDVFMKGVKDLDKTELLGRECYGGLDLSSKQDYTAFSLLFPDGRTEIEDEEGNIVEKDVFHSLHWFWIPENKLKERGARLDTSNIIKWEQDGFIKTTEGDIINQSIVSNDILKIIRDYDVKGISYDEWRAYGGVYQTISEGFDYMHPFSQTIRHYSEPTSELEAVVIDGRLNHFGNPVLRWMMRNVVILRDTNDNMRIVKNKSKDKVDGVISLAMAFGEYLTNDEDDELQIFL